LLLVGLCAGCGPGSAAEATLRRCKEQADDYAAALLAQDFAKFVQGTYAPFVKHMGGDAPWLTELLEAARKKKYNVLALRVSPADNLIVAGSDLLALLPLTMEVQVGKKKYAGSSYFLGVSGDQGKSWSFMDGGELDAHTIKTVLPHFPKNVSLPKKHLVEIKS
jgi:hypothetical protein